MRIRPAALVGSLVGAAWLLQAGVALSAPSLHVTSATVCALESETCTGDTQTFTNTAALRFITVVEGATGEAWVEHVWKRAGHEVFRLRLAVKGRRYRTTSKKTVAGLPGVWTAVVLDPVGRELAAVSFRVEEGRSAP